MGIAKSQDTVSGEALQMFFFTNRGESAILILS